MATDISGLRAQILANATLILGAEPPSILPSPPTTPPTTWSARTAPSPPPSPDDAANPIPPLDVVIFGAEPRFTAAVMRGLTPAIEGEAMATPEGALRRLLVATADLCHRYMPKLGSHQRNIHGGGVFDEDLLDPRLVVTHRKGGLGA